ncbi:hypothetical protein U9M48_007660 [Paspalum notatum var. saurae]|uniref:Uncharacterized protein n=1 Tax=Paspalum notatum var. saurae TaxID=547442 RepID=A0AAQ3SMM6_PASNO
MTWGGLGAIRQLYSRRGLGPGSPSLVTRHGTGPPHSILLAIREYISAGHYLSPSTALPLPDPPLSCSSLCSYPFARNATYIPSPLPPFDPAAAAATSSPPRTWTWALVSRRFSAQRRGRGSPSRPPRASCSHQLLS